VILNVARRPIGIIRDNSSAVFQFLTLDILKFNSSTHHHFHYSI